MKEEWKTIKDFPDYEVSDWGRVRSLKFGKEKILKPGKDNGGYLRINLCKNGKQYTKKVHRLVLETFNPIENMDKLQANHIDGNKENNYIGNLEWMTCSENHKHAYRIGLMNHKGKNHPMFGRHHSEETRKKQSEKKKGKYLGENNPFYGKHHSEETKRKQSEKMKGENNSRSILIEKDVVEIWRYLNEGVLTQKEIAEKFGVSRLTISAIKTGRNWNHV